MPVIRMTAVNAGGGVYHPPAIPMQIDAISEVTAINIACSSSDSAFNIAANSSGHTIISENGSVIDSVLTTQLLSINITGDSAGTTTVDFTGGDPLPTSGLSIDSGQLDITGSSGSDSLFTTATAAVFGDAEIRHPATGQTKSDANL